MEKDNCYKTHFYKANRWKTSICLEGTQKIAEDSVICICVIFASASHFWYSNSLVGFSEITYVKCIYPTLDTQTVSITITSSPAHQPLHDSKALSDKLAIILNGIILFIHLVFLLVNLVWESLNYAHIGSYILQFQTAKWGMEK